MRHELFDQWLRKNALIDHVMMNLRAANFDPEFYAHHEDEILESFNRASQEDL